VSIRHLDALFSPASVALIGASGRPDSVGATVWRNLRAGGFGGRLYAVNARHQALDGAPLFACVADLPEAPELAVVCTPPATVPGLIAELGARGTRAAVVITAGLSAEQKQAMLDAARVHTLRILGPNGIGLLSPHVGLNASFAPCGAAKGSLAFVSQSGALVTAMLDWAGSRGIGFSHFVSLGDSADVDFADLLDYLGSDGRTRAILLYAESVRGARKFLSAARAAARNKPVIVVKAGRSSAGQQAAASHTGALAGSDAVFDAAVARAGLLRVDTLQDLFLAAETLARWRDQGIEHLSILTNGGGAGVLAADAAAQAGVPLSGLSPERIAQLDAVLPANWSRGNPVDIIGDAPVARYVDALSALLADRQAAVLLVHAPTAIVPSDEIAQAVLPLAQAHPGRVLGCWLGGNTVAAARARCRAAGLPDFDTPEDAVRAVALLRTWREHQAELLQTPPARSLANGADLATIRRLVDAVLADGRELLTEAEAKALLAAAGVPTVPTQVVPPDADAAVAAAQALGWPVALKVLSRQITHKSDVGGVRLGIGNADELRAAVAAMLARVQQARPDATIDGFTVQPMVRLKHAHELIVGASVDPLFGPVLLFGAGGTAVEVLADRALALPPLNRPLALAQIARTRVARLLKGYRDEPAADVDAVAEALIAVSDLLAALPELAELDINPLLAHPGGVVALDARVRVSARRPAGAAAFAIAPYPQHLVQTLAWQGLTLTLRPIRAEDEPQHLAFLQRLDPDDIRLRVFYSRRHIEHSELARLTQIDYDREMAFVVTRPLPEGGEETLGTARASVDPDNQDAEFGVIVRSDLKGLGLGALLMKALIEHLRQRGTRRLVGTVLTRNTGMLGLARHLGFTETANPEDPGSAETRRVTLALQPG
jgi:acetyltransferase